MKRNYSLILICIISLGIKIAKCQDQPLTLTQSNASAMPQLFHKWEIGIDLLPLINKAKDPYGYVVKRSFKTEYGRQSIRLKLLPILNWANDSGHVSSTTVRIAIGYEQQREFGRFGLLYGADLFYNYDQQLAVGTLPNTTSKVIQINAGLSGFIGGRYYVSKHFSVTCESHLIFNYYNGRIFNFGNASSGNAHQYALSYKPINAVYFSYHF